jgi:iron-sulfur cluster repair protein YtfE (RIC family)
MSDALDMTVMYVAHDALRRDLEDLAKLTASKAVDGDPRAVLTTAAGWGLFKKVLHVHHTAEDDALWPPLREALAGRPDELALLAAMEDEHAAIDPLLDAIDATLADRESAPGQVGELVDSLATALTAHLKHEEDQALPLIQATLDLQQWRHFGEVNGRLIGPDAPQAMPWMLDGADEAAVAAMLAPLPEPVRAAYANEWVPAYKALDRWNTGA